MTQLFVWEAQDEKGDWYTLGYTYPEAGSAVAMVSRRVETARNYEAYARAHGETTGEDVRLVRYDETVVIA